MFGIDLEVRIVDGHGRRSEARGAVVDDRDVPLVAAEADERRAEIGLGERQRRCLGQRHDLSGVDHAVGDDVGLGDRVEDECPRRLAQRRPGVGSQRTARHDRVGHALERAEFCVGDEQRTIADGTTPGRGDQVEVLRRRGERDLLAVGAQARAGRRSRTCDDGVGSWLAAHELQLDAVRRVAEEAVVVGVTVEPVHLGRAPEVATIERRIDEAHVGRDEGDDAAAARYRRLRGSVDRRRAVAPRRDQIDRQERIGFLTVPHVDLPGRRAALVTAIGPLRHGLGRGRIGTECQVAAVVRERRLIEPGLDEHAAWRDDRKSGRELRPGAAVDRHLEIDDADRGEPLGLGEMIDTVRVGDDRPTS